MAERGNWFSAARSRSSCRVRQLPDLGVQRLHIDGGQRRGIAAPWSEHIGGPTLKLGFPRRDLIGMHIKLLRQLSQCSIALDRGKAGVWFRRARLLIVSPDSRANLARRQAETPLIALFRFAEPALKAA